MFQITEVNLRTYINAISILIIQFVELRFR